MLRLRRGYVKLDRSGQSMTQQRPAPPGCGLRLERRAAAAMVAPGQRPQRGQRTQLTATAIAARQKGSGSDFKETSAGEIGCGELSTGVGQVVCISGRKKPCSEQEKTWATLFRCQDGGPRIFTLDQLQPAVLKLCQLRA